MSSDPTTLERAFALARTGDYQTISDIRRRLKQERFDHVEGHLQGPSINRQLKLLCEEARRARIDA